MYFNFWLWWNSYMEWLEWPQMTPGWPQMTPEIPTKNGRLYPPSFKSIQKFILIYNPGWPLDDFQKFPLKLRLYLPSFITNRMKKRAKNMQMRAQFAYFVIYLAETLISLGASPTLFSVINNREKYIPFGGRFWGDGIKLKKSKYQK